MKLLALSQDTTIRTAGTTQQRMITYGTIVDELTIVLFGTGEYKEDRLSGNVLVISAGGTEKISAFVRGIKILKREAQKHDLISSQDPFFLGFASMVVGYFAHVPVQIQLHTDCFSWGYISEFPRRAVEALLAFCTLKGASCVRVVSERVAKSVMRITHAPVSVLPIRFSITSETHAPRPKEFQGAFTLLAVSRLTAEKQIHILIEALMRTKDIDLVIVGDGPLRKILEMQVKNLFLEKRVRFAGRVENVAEYYEHADVFVQSSRYEGYGMALMEAASHGLSIITTDVGIVGEVLRNNEEVLVVSDSVHEFTAAYLRMMGEPQFAEGLAARAKARAASFQKSESEYLAEYKKALLLCPGSNVV